MAPPQFWGSRFWRFFFLFAQRFDAAHLQRQTKPQTVTTPIQGAALVRALRGFGHLLPCGDCRDHFFHILDMTTNSNADLLEKGQWPRGGLFEWGFGVRTLISKKHQRPTRSRVDCLLPEDSAAYENFWWVLFTMALSLPKELSASNSDEIKTFLWFLKDVAPVTSALWEEELTKASTLPLGHQSFWELVFSLYTNESESTHKKPRFRLDLDVFNSSDSSDSVATIPHVTSIDDIKAYLLRELAIWIEAFHKEQKELEARRKQIRERQEHEQKIQELQNAMATALAAKQREAERQKEHMERERIERLERQQHQQRSVPFVSPMQALREKRALDMERARLDVLQNNAAPLQPIASSDVPILEEGTATKQTSPSQTNTGNLTIAILSAVVLVVMVAVLCVWVYQKRRLHKPAESALENRRSLRSRPFVVSPSLSS